MLQNKTDNLEKGKKITTYRTEQCQGRKWTRLRNKTENAKEENGQCYGRKQTTLRKNMNNVMEEYGQCYGRIWTMLGTKQTVLKMKRCKIDSKSGNVNRGSQGGTYIIIHQATTRRSTTPLTTEVKMVIPDEMVTAANYFALYLYV